MEKQKKLLEPSFKIRSQKEKLAVLQKNLSNNLLRVLQGKKEKEAEGKDKLDSLHENVDYVVCGLSYGKQQAILSEFGIHDAYVSYHDNFGALPEKQLAVVYHVLYECYMEEYQDEMD